jgi:hypothetical protein
MGKDDPIVEYEDEFGRMRTGRRSEIPRHLLQSDQNDEEEYVPHSLRNHELTKQVVGIL